MIRWPLVAGLIAAAAPLAARPTAPGTLQAADLLIDSLVGGQYLDEGEAAVIRPDGAGFQEVLRLGLAQWRAL